MTTLMTNYDTALHNTGSLFKVACSDSLNRTKCSTSHLFSTLRLDRMNKQCKCFEMTVKRDYTTQDKSSTLKIIIFHEPVYLVIIVGSSLFSPKNAEIHVLDRVWYNGS